MGRTSPAVAAHPQIGTKDYDWVRQSFLLPLNRWDNAKSRLSSDQKRWIYFTTADYKFQNTTLGGSLVINPLPSYTVFADIPRGGLLKGKNPKQLADVDQSMYGGMGRYYSEAIDDWSMRLTMRFGVPEYKGLITFFTGFYDAGAATLGRKGRLAGNIFYLGGRVIGSLVSIGFTALIWVGDAVRWLINRPATRYYNMKPTMALYWQRVNLIANHLAANLGITPRNDPTGADDPVAKYDPRAYDATLGAYSYTQLRQHYPNMFTKAGGIDVFYVANKAQRMQDRMMQQTIDILEKGAGKTGERIKEEIDSALRGFNTTYDHAKPITTLDQALKDYHNTPLGAAALQSESGEMINMVDDYLDTKAREKLAGGGGATSGDLTELAGGGSAVTGIAEGATAQPTESLEQQAMAQQTSQEDVAGEASNALADSADKDSIIWSVLRESSATDSDGTTLTDIADGWLEWADYAKSAFQEGGQWVNFRIDAVKSVSESFTNNVGPTEIQSKMNGISAAAQQLRISMSDFNTGFATFDSAVKFSDTFIGIADGLHISGLLSLAGAGFVDIPQHWTDSTAQMPSAQFTIKCRPPYGNVLSRFMNMHVPIAMILAASLPVSYGRHAYGSPFICEYYLRGRGQSRLAMITNVSITRGEGNLGWTKDGAFLGCDINFEITDLSSVMHAPIDSGYGKLLSFRWLIADDTVYNDYMAALSNLSVSEMVYNWEKLRLNYSRWRSVLGGRFTSSGMAMTMADTGIGRMVRGVLPYQNVLTQR